MQTIHMQLRNWNKMTLTYLPLCDEKPSLLQHAPRKEARGMTSSTLSFHRKPRYTDAMDLQKKGFKNVGIVEVIRKRITVLAGKNLKYERDCLSYNSVC